MVDFMRRIRRILVAVKNPAAKALPAVATAAQLARAFGAELVLFHAISTSLYPAGSRAARRGGRAVPQARRPWTACHRCCDGGGCAPLAQPNAR
jgi:nucleotide-binding universal stress UspA family protein